MLFMVERGEGTLKSTLTGRNFKYGWVRDLENGTAFVGVCA